MSGSRVDVVLITDDAELRARVGKHRPAEATVQYVASEELTPESEIRAEQVWIDLDSGARVPTAGTGQRVYFHSGPRPSLQGLPPGVWIRKPCAMAVFDVLWAGASTFRMAAPALPTRTTDESLPTWLLDFHELDLKVLCRKCVMELPPRLGYSTGSLYLHDARHGLLRLAETTHARLIDAVVPLDAVDQYLIASVARTGHLVRTDDVGAWRAGLGIPRRPDHVYDDGVCLVAPLVANDELRGVLTCSGRTSAAIESAPVEAVLEFVGRALHFACAYDQARLEARVDSLTGLFNQRWMMEVLDREIRRAQRFSNSLSVLMIDLDGLKAVNDQAGHAAGDCLLRHVANRIRGVLRQFDGAARVGGDEFIVMLPATDVKGAQHVARRLLQSIREDTARYRESALQITASIGVAEWRDGWDGSQLIDAADRAMYTAKSQGRDKLVCQSARRAPKTRPGTRSGPEAGQTPPPGMTRKSPPSPKAVPELSTTNASRPTAIQTPTRPAIVPRRGQK